ncbi:hypothetical protein JHJ32_02180 [Parapedobacter sp. ISTM3]|uniref:Uncharacterized protein n=1 Tax=Parapedobacter luteus TaxID=623280 RepID=A0A1T4ZY17_9SPHI|nr:MULTISPECIES: hypothetical protein [Parapedobacter]MBK1438782.1 hypothetical protein [Parapedobacter sp. ISTM3]SKB27620.1 hypothetical protein SAMN05660226_00287 [Parapedobacter luteus]
MYQSRREDYIERLIKRFFEALERIKSKGSPALDDALPEMQDDLALLYEEYFDIRRVDMLRLPDKTLLDTVDRLHELQLRPLALLLYHDALQQSSNVAKCTLLGRSKWLLERSHEITGQIDFEDVQVLNHIEQELADEA